MENAFAVGRVGVAGPVVVAPSELKQAVASWPAATPSSSTRASGNGSLNLLACGSVAAGCVVASGRRRAARGRAIGRTALATSTGQRVQWKGIPGVVKFVGEVKFAPGEWIGIELDEPKGMHDGSVFDQSYFSAKPKHGVFCSPADIGAGGGAPAAAPAAAAPMGMAPPAAAAPMGGGGSVAVGQSVTWKGNPGTVRFVGKVSFAAEEMVGIELSSPQGMHNGSLFGTTYFSCADKHGVFCKTTELGGGAPAPAAAAAAPAAPMPMSSPAPMAGGGSYSVGQRVSWKGNPGTVQFAGKVSFAAEEMIGVQLDSPNGMHNGSLFGTVYFSCPDKHGVFCKPSDLA